MCCISWQVFKHQVFLLLSQEEPSSCDTRRKLFYFFLCHRKEPLLVAQEEVSSCDTGRSFFLWHKKDFFLWHKKKLLIVKQERISSCDTRRGLFLCHKKRPLPVSQEEISSCARSLGAFRSLLDCRALDWTAYFPKNMLGGSRSLISKSQNC